MARHGNARQGVRAFAEHATPDLEAALGHDGVGQVEDQMGGNSRSGAADLDTPPSMPHPLKSSLG